ncbi:MAG: hypothetical protein ISS58_04700 [Dehalococcoidales bacterium]|nr:hypothetical protein [Dehalococcoidales bacterium]
MHEWIFQSHTAAGTKWNEGQERLKNNINAASGGRIVVTHHPAGAVVPGTQEFDGVSEGLLDMGSTCTMYWKDRFNAANLFTYTVAGLSPAESKIWHMQEGVDYLNQMIQEKDYDVYIPAGVITTPEMFLSTGAKELKSVADIKGLKIRTAGDDGVIFSRMGAAVVFLPSAEIYEAMQRGVINAFQLSSPAMDWSSATYEIAENIYLGGTRQPCEWMPMMFNTDSWNALDDDLKVLLVELIQGEAWNYYSMMTAADLVAVQSYIDYGTNIVSIPKDIEEEVVKEALILYEELSADDPFFAEVFQSIERFKATYRAAWPNGM